MSLRHMIKAFDCKIGSHVQKLVLIKLADNANEEGKCFPSLNRIANDCEISRRTVINAIKALEEKGFLIVHREKTAADMNKVNKYTLTLEGGESNSLGGESPALGGGESPAPRTSHSFEPPKEPKSDRPEGQSRTELVDRAYQYVWDKWKSCKKQIGKVDTSPKAKTLEKKWRPMFNQSYFKSHTEQQFKDEVNAICKFIAEAHAIEGFNRFENMQLPAFLGEKQWRD